MRLDGSIIQNLWLIFRYCIITRWGCSIEASVAYFELENYSSAFIPFLKFDGYYIFLFCFFVKFVLWFEWLPIVLLCSEAATMTSHVRNLVSNCWHFTTALERLRDGNTFSECQYGEQMSICKVLALRLCIFSTHIRMFLLCLPVFISNKLSVVTDHHDCFTVGWNVPERCGLKVSPPSGSFGCITHRDWTVLFAIPKFIWAFDSSQ